MADMTCMGTTWTWATENKEMTDTGKVKLGSGGPCAWMEMHQQQPETHRGYYGGLCREQSQARVIQGEKAVISTVHTNWFAHSGTRRKPSYSPEPNLGKALPFL